MDKFYTFRFYLINFYLPNLWWYLNLLERFFDVLEILALFFVINPALKIWEHIEKKFIFYYDIYLIKKKIKKSKIRKKKD